VRIFLDFADMSFSCLLVGTERRPLDR